MDAWTRDAMGRGEKRRGDAATRWRTFVDDASELEGATEVFYMISAPYAPDAGRGVRWDDPAFGIRWPGEVRVIHPRDAGYPLV